MDKNLISIITITRNRAGFISEAIESALGQSFPDWELIIIDDASQDNTREIAEDYSKKDSRIKYFRNDEHLRISKSRNKALGLARGEYVAVLDSDDVWSDRDKLKKQYEFLERNKDYVLVGGGVIVIDEHGQERKRYFNRESDENIRGKILFQNQFAHSSVMFKRDVALKVGGYDEKIKKPITELLFSLREARSKIADLPIDTIHKRIGFHQASLFGVSSRDYEACRHQAIFSGCRWVWRRPSLFRQ